MRRALVLVPCLILVLGVWWFVRVAPRTSAAGPGAELPEVEAGLDAASVLLEPPRIPEAEEDEAAPGSRGNARAAAPRRAEAAGVPANERAPLRGRLVIAESGDPIEGLFSVRLRTLDLVLADELLTRPDGSFRSRLPFPRGRLLALVKDEEGRELVDQEAAFDPEASDEWLVRVPRDRWPTFARGRVLDRRGNPCGRVRLQLIALADGGPFGEEDSDEDGRFQFDGLQAGAYRLRLQGRWASAPPREVEVRTGPNELGQLVFAETAAAGDLRVRLLAEDRVAWPRARLALAARDAGPTLVLDTLAGTRAEDGALELLVRDLPTGRYTLSVHCLDGLRAEPEQLEFVPPATLEFQLHGLARGGTVFRARDARTGEELLGFSALGCLDRTWELFSARGRPQSTRPTASTDLSELRMRPGFESWVVWTHGTRAVRGTFAGTARDDLVTVDLEPGWSALFQFEDGEAEAPHVPEFDAYQSPSVLEGVEIWAEGELAATSDADGFAMLSGEREPQSLEFRLAGRHAVAEYHFGILRTIVMAR